MIQKLSEGDIAPAFSAIDAQGNSIQLSNYAQQKVILYFYPQADTPACTNQACDFKDNLNIFQAQGYQVLGISPDSPKDLQKFTEKQKLNFPLLSDPDHLIAEAYGTWGEKKNYGKTYVGLIRSTFVIDLEGKISLAQYNVRAKGHVAKLRRDLGIDQ